jgi:outer membrane protein OmpA-like peptidoglycan-associated protein/tetratricopeptide (TPR) repeat protein
MGKWILVVLSIIGGNELWAQSKPKCMKLQEQAYMEYESAEFDKSIKTIAKAIKCDPTYASNYALQANLYETTGDTAAAVKAHKNCIKYDSLYQASYYYYAAYMFRLKRYNEALNVIDGYYRVPKMSGFKVKTHGATAALNDKVGRLKASVDMAAKEALDLAVMKIQNMGPSINSKYNEYWPGMPINSNMFVFTRLVEGENKGSMQEDFFMSVKMLIPDSGLKAQTGNNSTTDLNQTLQNQVQSTQNGSANGNSNSGSNSKSNLGANSNSGANSNMGSKEAQLVSTSSKYTWSKARRAPGKINTWENEGTTSVYMGPSLNEELYFTVCNQGGFGSCDLFVSKIAPNTAAEAELELKNNQLKMWGPRANLGESVNSASWDAQPSVSGDGQMLIFASSRPGGFGGKDLWVSRKVRGRWTSPKNLGPKINTSSDEEAPFIHYDGRTLYFSSNGHPGYGGHDLFIARLDDQDQWSKPTNLGVGVNTESDDVGFYVDALAEKAYFASARPGGFGGLDIYEMYLPEKFKPSPVSYLRGIVRDAETKAPLVAKVRLVDLITQKTLYEDSVQQFLIPIVAGKNYALHSSRSGYLFDSRNFQPTQTELNNPFEVTALLSPLKLNQVITLNNIFFDVDKFDLKPESEVELKTMLWLLNSNPKMKLEISGHTDNTGTEIRNKTLSENRASAVKMYLVNAGISVDRIVSKGYGSSKPAASNETEEGRARNRRIEARILAN